MLRDGSPHFDEAQEEHDAPQQRRKDTRTPKDTLARRLELSVLLVVECDADYQDDADAISMDDGRRDAENVWIPLPFY